MRFPQKQYTPLLDNFGLVEIPFERAVKHLEPTWFRCIRLVFGQISWTSLRNGGALAALKDLPFLDAIGTRMILMSTTDDRVVIITNSIDQSPLTGVVSELCIRLRCKGFVFMLRDQTPQPSSFQRSPWATYGFTLFDGDTKHPHSSPVRSVYFSEEYNKWELEQFGSPLPCEKDKSYATARDVESRRNAIVDILTSIKADPFDSEFYADHYSLYRVERIFPLKRVPIETAQRELGINKE